jgi:heme/copper-type cytochrome/quinol oxidase subunit 1
MTGRMLDEGLGKLHFWFSFVAMNITFFPMHFTGVDGMPRRVYTYAASDGWTTWNLLASLGSFLLGASVLIFLYNWLKSLRSGAAAGNDPWDGGTLEWSIPSPPPEHDFDRIPFVTSSRPHWDTKYGAGSGPGGAVAGGAEAGGEPEAPIHMPKPSFWPAVSAVGILLFWTGFLLPTSVALYVSLGGVLVFLVALYSWLYEPLE